MPQFLPYGLPPGIPLEPIALSMFVEGQETEILASQPIPIDFYIVDFTSNCEQICFVQLFIGPPNIATLDQLYSNAKPLFKYVPTAQAGLFHYYSHHHTSIRSGPYPPGSCIYAVWINMGANDSWNALTIGIEPLNIGKEYPERP